MQEEISLREIFEVIWNNKLLISAVTAITVLVAVVLNFFAINPTYEAASTVRVANNPEVLKSYAESINSDITMDRVIHYLNLSGNYTIQSLRRNIKVETVDDTHLLRITVSGINKQTITSIANMLSYELGARIEISERSAQIVNLKNEVLNLEDELIVINKELVKTLEQLNHTPQILITRQSLAGDSFLQSVVQDLSALSAEEAGSLTLESESMNPLYMNLQARVADSTIHISKTEEEIHTKEQAIRKHEESIQRLETHNTARLDETNSQRLLGGFNAIFISSAIEPSESIAPKKIQNISIGFVVGMMFGMLITFIRHYWNQTNSKNNTSGNNLSM